MYHGSYQLGGKQAFRRTATAPGELQANCRHDKQCGEFPVAGHEGIGQDCNHTLPLGVDDAASRHADSGATQPHTHGQRLLAAAVTALKAPVKAESNPGKKAEILQQCEQREEDCHRRKHHGYHPRNSRIHAIQQ